MADNQAAAESAQPTAEQHYASRQATTTPAPSVIPEPPTADMPKPQPVAQSDDADEAQTDEQTEPAEEDGENQQDEAKPDDKRPSRRTLRDENFRLREKNRSLREQLAAAQGQPQPPKQATPAQPTPEAPKKPRQEDFENYEQYLDARDDWNRQRWQADQDKRQQQRENERSLSDQHKAAADKFTDSADKARAKYADFDEVVFDQSVTITPVMAQIVTEADNPGELAYWLGQNPQEARRIAGMSPPRAAIELGKIEAKLSTVEPPKPKAPPKPSIPETKAPPPTKPVPQGTARQQRRLEELPQQDFYARRTAQLNKR